MNIEIIEVTAEQKLDIIELEKINKLNNELVIKLTAFSNELELDSLSNVLSEENYQKLLDELKKSKVAKKTSKDNVTTITKELPPESNARIFGKELSEIEKLEEIQKVNSIKLDKKTSILNEKIGQRNHLKSLFNFIIYPMLVLMLVGFYLWYQKVQKYQDIIIKAQALQSRKKEN